MQSFYSKFTIRWSHYKITDKIFIRFFDHSLYLPIEHRLTIICFKKSDNIEWTKTGRPITEAIYVLFRSNL